MLDIEKNRCNGYNIKNTYKNRPLRSITPLPLNRETYVIREKIKSLTYYYYTRPVCSFTNIAYVVAATMTL